MPPATLVETLYGNLEQALHEMQEVVRTSTPESVSGDQARRFVERFAEAERVGPTGPFDRGPGQGAVEGGRGRL